MDDGEGGAALEKSSEYPCSLKCISIWYMMIVMRLLVLYLLLADPLTRLEQLVHEPLGAETRETVVGEGGEALEEPSEYPCSFLAAIFDMRGF